MRAGSAALLACALGAAAGWCSTARAGAHAAPIIIVTPRAAPIDMGEPAYVPMVLGPSGKDGAGPLAPGVVVDPRSLTPEAGVILTETIDSGGVLILDGTVLVRTVLERTPDVPAPRGRAWPKEAWCSTGVMPLGHAPVQDCLVDSDGDGRMDEFWRGSVADRAAPLEIQGLIFGKVLDRPAAYRAAPPDAVPGTVAGYRFCAGQGDGVSAPYRFRLVLRNAHGAWPPETRDCAVGAWPDAQDKTVEQVDGLKLKLTPGPAPAYALLDAPPAGPAAPARTGQRLAARTAPSVAVARRVEALLSEPLVATGAPGQMADGLVEHGAVLVEAPVRHGVTGVLQNDVTLAGPFFSKDVLKAGQFMFAVPMNSGLARGTATSLALTWCAPRLSLDTKGLRTLCFPRVGEALTFVDAGPALMVTSFRFFPGQTVVGLNVERRAVAFERPMRLAYVFDRWAAEEIGQGRHVLFARLRVEIRSGDLTTYVGELRVAPFKDGVHRLPLLGGAMTLTPLDRAGRPLALPAQVMTRGEADAVRAQLQGDRAQVRRTSPFGDRGGLPLAGMTGRAAEAPPALEISPAALDALGATPPSAPGAP